MNLNELKPTASPAHGSATSQGEHPVVVGVNRGVRVCCNLLMGVYFTLCKMYKTLPCRFTHKVCYCLQAAEQTHMCRMDYVQVNIYARENCVCTNLFKRS